MEITELNVTQHEKNALISYAGYEGPDDQPSNTNSLGPVVQSIVSLTSSLRVISLTILTDSIYNILIFFAEKM